MLHWEFGGAHLTDSHPVVVYLFENIKLEYGVDLSFDDKLPE
jgi:hypothetical protein